METIVFITMIAVVSYIVLKIALSLKEAPNSVTNNLIEEVKIKQCELDCEEICDNCKD